MGGFILFILCFSSTTANGEEQLSLTYYGQTGCSSCVDKYNMIQDFISDHPEILAEYLWVPDDISFQEYYDNLTLLGEDTPKPLPGLVLNYSGEIIVLYTIDINRRNLDLWRLGLPLSPTEFTIGVAFVVGLVTGISACMLLLLSVLGTSLTIIESRSKYFIISTGLIIGLVCTYLVVSVLFLVTINALSIISLLKYIFGGILLFIGIWQIIEFKSEKSVMFGTSNRIKSVLRDFIEKRSALYAFLVGIIFAFIKIPCFGGPYLQMLFSSQYDPLLSVYIIFYFLGMLLPIIGVLLAIRIGLQSEKVNKFRLEYRPYLRLLSGCFLITLTLYLFFDMYISIQILLWVILGELLIFCLLIWIKSKKLKDIPEESGETT